MPNGTRGGCRAKLVTVIRIENIRASRLFSTSAISRTTAKRSSVLLSKTAVTAVDYHMADVV